jgi:4-hydroxy-3-methylbut-2-enyl diphosphate reductase
VCEQLGVPAYLVDDLREVRPEWLERANVIAVTAGASAPENLVEALVESLHSSGYTELEEMEVKEEDVRFNLPAELVRVQMPQAAAGV